MRIFLIQSDHAEFEYMNYSNHHSSITGVDVCIRKPIIATCSTDRSVRIWNFETGFILLNLNKTKSLRIK